MGGVCSSLGVVKYIYIYQYIHMQLEPTSTMQTMQTEMSTKTGCSPQPGRGSRSLRVRVPQSYLTIAKLKLEQLIVNACKQATHALLRFRNVARTTSPKMSPCSSEGTFPFPRGPQLRGLPCKYHAGVGCEVEMSSFGVGIGVVSLICKTPGFHGRLF